MHLLVKTTTEFFAVVCMNMQCYNYTCRLSLIYHQEYVHVASCRAAVISSLC